jgi:hypothetical protein
MWRKSITSPSCAWFIAAARSRSMTNRVCLWGHFYTMLTKIPIIDNLPAQPRLTLMKEFLLNYKVHTVDISSTTYLPRLVNIVKERPPVWSIICCYIRYIRTNGFKSLVGFDDKKHVCYVSMNVMYNSCKNTSRWLLQTNLSRMSRSKSGVQLWALTRLASKKRNKKPKRMMRVLIP